MTKNGIWSFVIVELNYHSTHDLHEGTVPIRAIFAHAHRKCLHI